MYPIGLDAEGLDAAAVGASRGTVMMCALVVVAATPTVVVSSSDESESSVDAAESADSEAATLERAAVALERVLAAPLSTDVTRVVGLLLDEAGSGDTTML